MANIPKKAQQRPWMPERKPFENRKNDNMRFYNSQRWRTLRRMHLNRFPLCEYCKTDGMTTLAAHVDHITPINKGGAMLDPHNLQSLCLSCHAKKTASE